MRYSCLERWKMLWVTELSAWRQDAGSVGEAAQRWPRTRDSWERLLHSSETFPIAKCNLQQECQGLYSVVCYERVWPRQTKPKKGQFMNFSQGHSGTKVRYVSFVPCFPKEKHQNSQKWAKFMNFSFWPFLWFGLPGRLLSYKRVCQSRYCGTLSATG